MRPNIDLPLLTTEIDRSSEDSFPASDPPAWTPLRAGAPRRTEFAPAPGDADPSGGLA